MQFLLIVCWDAEDMNALAEPEPGDKPDDESFPWLDDLQARGKWVTGDQLARRDAPAPSAFATGRRASPTVRSPRPRRRSAAST